MSRVDVIFYAAFVVGVALSLQDGYREIVGLTICGVLGIVAGVMVIHNEVTSKGR